MIPLLADQFRVMTPDSRGHGRSTNPSGRLSFPTIADDLAAMIAALELDRPVVAGWSDGGQITLELAARHPGAAGPIIVLAGDRDDLIPLDLSIAAAIADFARRHAIA
jgi:pimeloyl-ACP methyl ester carboxylesterase